MKKLRKFKRNIFDKDKLSKWARSVKKRDGFKCRACGYKGYLHSHHILPKSKFFMYAYSIWNGITLCKKCHLGENGVHGKNNSQNKVVSDLRKLMFSNDIEKIKSYSKFDSKEIVKYVSYTKFKKNFKRKLF